MGNFTRHIHAIQTGNQDVVDALHFLLGTGRWKEVIKKKKGGNNNGVTRFLQLFSHLVLFVVFVTKNDEIVNGKCNFQHVCSLFQFPSALLQELLHHNGPENVKPVVVGIQFDNSEGKCTAAEYKTCKEISVVRQLDLNEKNTCWINKSVVPNDCPFFDAIKIVFVSGDEVNSLLSQRPSQVSTY